MALLHRASPDIEVLSLFEESGRNVAARRRCCCATCSSTTPSAPTSRASSCSASTRATASPTTSSTGSTAATPAAPPMDPIDGYQLATALDDIVDFAEQTADNLGLYRVEAPMEQASQMGDVLVGAGEQVARALRSLRTGARPRALPRRDPPPRERGRPASAATASRRCSSTASTRWSSSAGRTSSSRSRRASTRASTSPTCSRASRCAVAAPSGRERRGAARRRPSRRA